MYSLNFTEASKLIHQHANSDDSNKVLENYTKRVLINMVDDVCLYLEKVE